MSNFDGDPGNNGRMLEWVMFLAGATLFSCIEASLIISAIESGNWVTPIAIGLVGAILGFTAINNLTKDEID